MLPGQKDLNISRVHEALIHHMSQVADIQDHKGKGIDAIKCKLCGETYPYIKEKCPPYGTVCSECGWKNNWSKACIDKTKGNMKNLQSKPHMTLKHPVPRRHWGLQSETNWVLINHIDVLNQNLSGVLDKQISFHSMEQQNRGDTWGEVFPSLNVTLPNRSEIHKLKAKVDNGAEGNTLLLRIFQKMFPEKVNSAGLPLPDSTHQETAILTADNGATIPQHRFVNIQCAYYQSFTRSITFGAALAPAHTHKIGARSPHAPYF